MVLLCSGVPTTPHDGNMARSDAVRPRQPSSHKLRDRSARAGAAPGRVPVLGRKHYGTTLTQEFS